MRGSPRKFDTKDCQNMAIVTGDRYLEFLVKFVEKEAGPLIEGTLVLKLNPVGLHYVQSRLEALQELEGLLAGAPVDYLRAYISDLGDHRALEQVRRILRLLTSVKVVSVLPPPARDPTPLSLLPFGRLKVLEIRGCDLSTSAAKGLLELRHTLERITCHNSTDALRHVFASRIVDIKKSPVWNRLSFVSCACNDLVLMDESLQLLPVVETLDLSRNRFAKVDNLRKCAKLRHLDLGFNHLKSISSFSEVACPIVKLVLRHNALTTLRGVENLKFLEGLDLSYNVISSFSELCILATLPSLQSLWLEGNPICCARWYRAQVFAIFTYPERLKLDEKEITTKESWKRQIILASRQKKPAGFGFYSPARDNAEEEGNLNTKRKKPCRLAMIEDEECKILTGLEATEQESPSCDSDIRSREENALSDGESEIVGLMNRVEFMKKERSVLWLREFKDWMDHPPEEITDASKFSGLTGRDGEDHVNTTNGHKHLGESSSYVSDSAQASGDESSTNVLESDNSYADTFIGLHGYKYFSSIGESTSVSMIDSGRDGIPILMVGENDKNQEKLKPHTREHVNHLNKAMDAHLPDALSLQKGDVTDLKHATPLKAIDEIMDSHSSSTFPGSPPHYKEDILHRRHNLEEEFMQLSAESYSLVSSDTDTSSSDDDFYKLDSSLPRVDEALNDQSSKIIMDDQLVLSNNSSDRRHDMSDICQNGRHSFDPKPIDVMESNAGCLLADVVDHDFHAMSQEMGCLEKKRRNWKSKRRIISLCEEIFRQDGRQNDTLEVSVADMDQIHLPSSSLETYSETFPISKPIFSQFFTEEFIKNYFHLHVAHSSASETCLHYMICTSILRKDSRWIESEVIILQSSEDKLYILLVDTISDGSGLAFDVIGCHRLGEINEVVFGLGLQILRVHIGKDASYVFITRNIEKSRRLITIFGICDFRDTYDRCSLRSVEQAQIELFEKHICGSSKINIFLYSMLLFWCTNSEKESWLSRSLFVIKGYVLVCIEDLMQFRSIELADDASSIPYFCLDSCCSISNISEMIIEPKESLCQMTLSAECIGSKKLSISGNDPELQKMETALERVAVGSCTWKLKWFSEQALLTFVSLLKALHAETGVSPLPVRCVS